MLSHLRPIFITALCLQILAGNTQERPHLSVHLIDTTQTATLGLEQDHRVETFTIFSPSDTTDHYANGVVMTAWHNSLYCMWQSSKTDEDSPDTWVAYSRSLDGGLTWTAPLAIMRADEHYSYTSGGWLINGDTLIALVNRWPHEMLPRGGEACYCASTDGQHWSTPHPLLMADGTTMKGVIEQDPLRLADGRLVGAAHFQPGLHVCPIYTDDPRALTGWHRAKFESEDRGKQSRELEPSQYLLPDGTIVMLFRDQQTTYRKRFSLSNDQGETWTAPADTDIPDARVKQSAGNLPDGSVFLVANPTGCKRRWPLVVLLSSDGLCFHQAILLRAGDADLQPQHYAGKAKTLGYNYPKSFLLGGHLYVAYATNKEDVQFSRLQIEK